MVLTEKERYENFDFAIKDEKPKADILIPLIINELGINLANKKVIDIGSGLGYKSAKMIEYGADVLAVEPDSLRVSWAADRGILDPKRILNCYVQDIPIELYGTFDIATIFLYRIIPGFIRGFECNSNSSVASDINDMQLQVTKVLAKLLKPDGIAIIEFCNAPVDYYLYYPDGSYTPLIYQMKKAFNEAEYVDTSSSRSIIIVAKKPLPAIEVDQLNYSDVCMLDLSLKKSTIEVMGELIKQGCYYTGTHSPNTFVISDDARSLRYVNKKQSAI